MERFLTDTMKRCETGESQTLLMLLLVQEPRVYAERHLHAAQGDACLARAADYWIGHDMALSALLL